MTDLVTRSGRCHGPGCERVISMWGRSPDFCDEDCQAKWHAKWGAKMLVAASTEAECLGCGWRTEGTASEVSAAIAEHVKQQQHRRWLRRAARWCWCLPSLLTPLMLWWWSR